MPDYSKHTFPLFEHTQLTAEEVKAIRAEGIKFSVALQRLVDPGNRLSGKVVVQAGVTSRYPGQAPVAGQGAPGDTKKKGVALDVRRKEKEVEYIWKDRGVGLVKGKKVRARTHMSKQMQIEAAKGLAYRGVLEREEKLYIDGPYPKWDFWVNTKGMAGADTAKQYKVTLQRVCECTCKAFDRMKKKQSTPYVWCKHIYAILQKVLKFDANEGLMTQMAWNLEELETVIARKPDMLGLQ